MVLPKQVVDAVQGVLKEGVHDPTILGKEAIPELHDMSGSVMLKKK